MGFNYGREKRNFDKVWERLEEEYREAGMPEDKIQQMKDFDWQWFCSERTYRNHVCALPVGDTPEDAYINIDRGTTSSARWDDEGVNHSRLSWVSAIEDEELYRKLRNLSNKDLELLTLIYFDGFQQAEIARTIGCSRNTIHKKLKKIKNYLKNG